MTGVSGTFGAGWDGNGPGSFDVNGEAQGQQHPSAGPGFPSYETAKQIATLQSRLDRKLGPEYVSQRAGPGGSKLTYIEGWKVINVANEVFGFNGWSSTVQRLETDFCDTNPTTGRVSVGISAIIRITLRDGTVHEDVGYGEISNSPSKAAAFDKCKKEAITDAVKRSLRSFGNVLGNCLYDKEYTKEINKMKTPTVR
ncbi:recombination protein Rad52, partial [Mrakia frigida]